MRVKRRFSAISRRGSGLLAPGMSTAREATAADAVATAMDASPQNFLEKQKRKATREW
jgi:hypothetical protein